MPKSSSAPGAVGKRRVAVNLVSNQIGFFVPAIITFFLSPFVVHALGDHVYGLWSLVVSFAGHYGLLTMGVQSASTRYVAHAAGKGDSEATSRYVNSALWMLLPAGGLAVMVGSGLAGFLGPIFSIPPEDLSAAQLACVLMAVTAGVTFATAVFSSILTAYQRFDSLNLVRTSAVVVRSLFTVWLLSNGHEIVALAWLSLVVAGVSGLGFIGLAKVQCPGWRIGRGQSSRSSLKTLLGFGGKSLVGTLSLTLIYQCDLFVIGIFMTPADITMYSLGSTLLFYIVQFNNSIVHVIDPYATQRFAQRGIDGLRDLFAEGSVFIYALGGAIAGCGVAFARPFFALWIDPQHVQSGTIFSLLVVAQFFNVGARFGHSMLVGMARIGTFNTVSLLGGVANLLLSVLLIRRYGILGVAFGTIIPMFIVDALWFIPYMSRLLGLNPGRVYLRSVGPGVLIALAGLGAGTFIQPLVPPVTWVGLFTGAVLALTACCGTAWFVLPKEVAGVRWRARALETAKRISSRRLRSSEGTGS